MNNAVEIDSASSVEINIRNHFLPMITKTRNIIGYLKGDVKTPTPSLQSLPIMIIIGSFGKATYYPGAHDNASECYDA